MRALVACSAVRPEDHRTPNFTAGSSSVPVSGVRCPVRSAPVCRAGAGTAPSGGHGSTPSSSGTSSERRSWANIDQLAMAITTSRRARSSGTTASSSAQVAALMAPPPSVSSVAASTARSARSKRSLAFQSRTATRSSSGISSIRATRQCWVHSYIEPWRQPIRMMISSRRRASSAPFHSSWWSSPFTRGGEVLVAQQHLEHRQVGHALGHADPSGRGLGRRRHRASGCGHRAGSSSCGPPRRVRRWSTSAPGRDAGRGPGRRST